MNEIEEIILKLYHQEKQSIRQVAATINKSPPFVRKRLKDMGIIRSQTEGYKYRSTDKYRKKLKEKQIGESNNQAKLNEKAVLEIRNEYKSMLELGSQKTDAQKYLAEKYGVKRPTISDIVLKRTWKHI